MFLLIEPCNFKDRPVGGQVTFCRQLLDVFGPELTLVGVNTENEPVGKWYDKIISGTKYRCFNLYTLSNRRKPIIPLRVRNFFYFLYYRNRILSKNKKAIFIHAPEISIALTLFNRRNFVYHHMFHGVENPLRKPRYAWGKLLAGPFERLLFRSLQRAGKILVCADRRGIEQLKSRAGGLMDASKLVPFPTRYDDKFFFPPNSDADLKPRMYPGKTVLVSLGRISRAKGWDLLLEAFRAYVDQSDNKDAVLVFVGDGEDRAAMERRATELGISARVVVSGFVSREEVRKYLWRADLALVGSYNEGWSIAMLEALACGKAIVSTDVSGARDMIRDGENGFVVPSRDPGRYANSIIQALELSSGINQASLRIAQQYRLSDLRETLMAAFSERDKQGQPTEV